MRMTFRQPSRKISVLFFFFAVTLEVSSSSNAGIKSFLFNQGKKVVKTAATEACAKVMGNVVNTVVPVEVLKPFNDVRNMIAGAKDVGSNSIMLATFAATGNGPGIILAGYRASRSLYRLFKATRELENPKTQYLMIKANLSVTHQWARFRVIESYDGEAAFERSVIETLSVLPLDASPLSQGIQDLAVISTEPYFKSYITTMFNKKLSKTEAPILNKELAQHAIYLSERINQSSLITVDRPNADAQLKKFIETWKSLDKLDQQIYSLFLFSEFVRPASP